MRTLRLVLFFTISALGVTSAQEAVDPNQIETSSIKVWRSSFYDNGSAFFESIPEEHLHAGRVCNCTEFVKERPAGTPDQIKTGLKVVVEYKDKKWPLEISFSLPTHFSGETVKEKPRLHLSAWEGSEHKYFWFSTNSLQLEYPAKRHGYVDYILQNIFRGDNIDLSTFMNGHSPSRVVKKGMFKDNTVWMPDCSGGKEAYEILPMPELVDIFDTVNSVITELSDMGFTSTTPLEEMRTKVANSKTLESNFQKLARWAKQTDVLKTPIYQAASRIIDAIR